jgi:predicted transcriptional regulator
MTKAHTRHDIETGAHMNKRRARPILPKDANAKLRQAQCLELRIQGLSQSQIAERVGMSQPAVSRAIARALQAHRDERVDDLRKVDSMRMEDLHNLAWKYAEAGDMAAASVLVRLLDRRAKLFGLDAAGANGGSARLDYSVVARLYSTSEAERVRAVAEKRIADEIAWHQKSVLPSTLVYDGDIEVPAGADPEQILKDTVVRVISARPDDKVYMHLYILRTPAYRASPNGPVIAESPAERLAEQEDEEDEDFRNAL